MSRILIFIVCYVLIANNAGAAIRDGNSVSRASAATQRVVSTYPVSRDAISRKTVTRPQTDTTRRAKSGATVATGRTTKTNVSRTATPRVATQNIVSRAATSDTSAMSQTRTGAEYEQCKNAYFTCMDQFCQLKNDTYRRCSCSDRVYNLGDTFDTLAQAGEQLTTFTENLDVVGMTAAQASSMKTASEGENALTGDKSASKALLQAIMNSIRGTDASVGGKYSDLNSINMSFDTVNAFGTADAGQVIATYNGKNLYLAVYPQCRNAVRDQCNDASLQRAINAYLMAVEQDCNTVQTAIENKQKQMKAAVREGSAMLDLARVENRQKHNSSDFTACLNDVESAILSEEVCGANYHKCLDNGEFIDISTGKPIAGVKRFYELEQLLTFNQNVDAANQKLSKVTNNHQFVNNFEARVKKFAAPALDKCVEKADDVWAEYLDKAMLDIYYAQKSKVSEIKQGCFDFISSCYMNVDSGITAAMQGITDGNDIVLQPDKIELNTRMCSDYIDSCDKMFDDNIIAEYVNNRKDTDKTAACRAVVKQCFDKFGGSGYQNFYNPGSGIFQKGYALDWLTLYEYTYNTDNNKWEKSYKSECAKQLTTIDSCNKTDIIESVFGGFDKVEAVRADSQSGTILVDYKLVDKDTSTQDKKTLYTKYNSTTGLKNHDIRPTGVATEVYYQIISMLSKQCAVLQGRFMELQFTEQLYKADEDACISNFYDTNSPYNRKEILFPNSNEPSSLNQMYGIGKDEDMCPYHYKYEVDTASWGACLCWENGGRRSKWGKTSACVAAVPTRFLRKDGQCYYDKRGYAASSSTTWQYQVSYVIDEIVQGHSEDNWCTAHINNKNQVCPMGVNEAESKDKCLIKYFYVGRDVDPSGTVSETRYSPKDGYDPLIDAAPNLPLGITE